jgi:hypothetical protein
MSNLQTIFTPIPIDWSGNLPTARKYKATISLKMGNHWDSKNEDRKSCQKIN